MVLFIKAEYFLGGLIVVSSSDSLSQMICCDVLFVVQDVFLPNWISPRRARYIFGNH